MLKLYTGSLTEKQVLDDWEEILVGLRKKTPPRKFNTPEEKADYKKRIEKPGNEEEWFKEMFPNYYKSKAATFHKRSTKRLLGKRRYKQVRRWARGLSKSVRRMMELFYKHFVEGYPINMLLISKSEDNAARLLDPYRANLQANQRLIDMYGVQERPGKWTNTEFITRKNASFRAVGAGQNPRGARLEDLRVTVLLFDDLDDDEVCENIDRMDKIWNWVQKAVLPTVDISGDYLILFDNNPIAEDCLVNRMAAMVEDNEIVPLITDSGSITWPEKNNQQDIDDLRSTMTDWAWQTEYLCNPVRPGKTFPEMTWGKCPPLSKLQFAVIYADPATSNADIPVGKSTAQNSCKSVAIVGYYEGKYYLYRCFNHHVNTATFVEWLFLSHDYVVGKATPFTYIENNTLQDPFYGQVIQPALFNKAKEMHRAMISISPDERKKPNKFLRIEATLQPLNKNSLLILNIDEKEDPHMKRMYDQFKAVSPKSKTMDGPDAVEGAVWLIQNKINFTLASKEYVKSFKPKPNKKRF